MKVNIIIGSFVMLMMLSAAGASDLSEFPGMFIEDIGANVVVVVGKSAKAEDVLGAIDIVASLQYELNKELGTNKKIDVARFDTEVLKQDPSLEMNNYITVGGPCINSVSARFMGYPDNCMEGFDLGKAWIKLYELGNEHTGMMVAGATALDTKRAAYVVSNHGDYEFEGSEMTVSKVNIKDININPVD
ncbi:hypothetical protein GF336_02535 [Candidatus Woesearchaeota archaeon]|nr:hypothetical protein [Candidatus Woesearchaeota archaeon]